MCAFPFIQKNRSESMYVVVAMIKWQSFLNDGAAQAMDDRNRADAKPEGKANNNNFCIPCSLSVYCYALKSYHIVHFKGYF